MGIETWAVRWIFVCQFYYSKVKWRTTIKSENTKHCRQCLIYVLEIIRVGPLLLTQLSIFTAVDFISFDCYSISAARECGRVSECLCVDGEGESSNQRLVAKFYSIVNTQITEKPKSILVGSSSKGQWCTSDVRPHHFTSRLLHTYIYLCAAKAVY